MICPKPVEFVKCVSYHNKDVKEEDLRTVPLENILTDDIYNGLGFIKGAEGIFTILVCSVQFRQKLHVAYIMLERYMKTGQTLSFYPN